MSFVAMSLCRYVARVNQALLFDWPLVINEQSVLFLKIVIPECEEVNDNNKKQ